MKIKLTILLLFFAQITMSQILPNYGGQRAGLSTLGFLKNDMNPRSVALGGASVAISGQALSLINNPAAVTSFSHFTLGLSNTLIGAGVQQNFLAAVLPFKGSHFGISVNSLNSGAMEVRTEFQPDGTGEFFYVNNLATGLTYSKALSDMFSMGLTLKYIYEQIAEYTNHTAAFDLAFMYKTDFKDLRFAVMIQNFGGNSSLTGDFLPVTFNRDTSSTSLSSYTVPTNFRMGVSFMPYNKGKHSIMVAAELQHPNDNAENIRLGVEYGFASLLFIRAGYKLSVLGQSLPSFGFGVKSRIGANPLYINYGILPTNFFGVQHTFGVGFNLNKDKRE